MNVAPGLTTHTVVVCTDKRERGLAIQAILAKTGFKVVLSTSIYDALRFAAQEMPHLIVCEALISDGTAGILYDRLLQHEVLKHTPILVHVLKKSRAELAPLAQRQFAGFLLGKLDPRAFYLKIKEIMGSHSQVSPHFLPAEGEGFSPEVTVSMEGTLLGLVAGHVVCRSTAPVDPGADLVCAPRNKALPPVVFRHGTNLPVKSAVFHLFPLNRASGPGRVWTERLPDLTKGEVADEQALMATSKATAKVQEAPKDLPRVLFHIRNQEYFDAFSEILEGFDIALEPAPTLSQAAQMLARDPSRFSAVYIHGFANEQERVQWHNATCQIDRKIKPAVVVGVTDRRSSLGDAKPLKRPYGLGRLIEVLEASFQKRDMLDSLEGIGAGSGIAMCYRSEAVLLGLDETGGIIQTSFPLVRGGRIDLGHDFLQKAWDGNRNVLISAVAQLPGQADVWQARFEAVAAGTSKTKYWEKVYEAIVAVRPAPPASPEPDIDLFQEAQEGQDTLEDDLDIDAFDIDEGSLGDDLKDLDLGDLDESA